MSNTGGRPLRFETPELLMEAFEGYVEHCLNNPIPVQEKGAKEVLTVMKDRPITLLGFCVHIKMARRTLDNLAKQDGFLTTVTHIKDFTRSYCSDRAMVDAFNPRFVGGYFGTESEEENKDKNKSDDSKTINVYVNGEKAKYFPDADNPSND